jgi:predicted DNA-binding transcriptional regulator YafY
MRAGRLITLIIVLQRRGRSTAAELAAELEVSERTVLRDLEALSGAGVPVYATRGPAAGFSCSTGTAPK